MAKVSIIMGVYNPKGFEGLKKSVNSIISQTYQDWEFIICNDGSDYKTAAELRLIETADCRIRVIGYQENRGLCYALNRCIAEAKGKYIARQDDDDISHPQRLEKQIEFLEANPGYDIVGTNAYVFNDCGTWGEYIVDEKPTKKSFLWNSPFIHPSVIMRTDSLCSVGGYRVAKETRRCEDYDLFMRMYAKGMIGYNIQDKLYDYRIVNNPNKKYRPMSIRMDEAKVRFQGYKDMGILLEGIPYIIKPIIIGVIPAKFIAKIKEKRY